jgi:hypothetical protein
MEAFAFSSHGRAPKRKSTVVNAPTGQISVVLPEKTESNPGSETEMIWVSRPRSSKPSTASPTIFILKADAARALNTAFAVEPDQFAERDRFGEAHASRHNWKRLLPGTVRHGQVLKRTFAALVTDRAIQRVRSQQEFDRALLSFRLPSPLGHRPPCRLRRVGAGRFEFGHELDLGLRRFPSQIDRWRGRASGGQFPPDTCGTCRQAPVWGGGKKRGYRCPPFGGIDNIRAFGTVTCFKSRQS